MAQLEKSCAVKLGYDIVRAATGLGNTDIYSVTDIFDQKLLWGISGPEPRFSSIAY